MNQVSKFGIIYHGRNKSECEELLIIVNNDGFVSVRGRKLDERWIHQASFYVAGISLQINLSRVITLFSCLRHYFCYL